MPIKSLHIFPDEGPGRSNSFIVNGCINELMLKKINKKQTDIETLQVFY